ncbi:hypothetical protein ABEZ87_31410 [Bacillus mycoides]
MVSLEPLYTYAREPCYMTPEIEKAIQGGEAGMLLKQKYTLSKIEPAID